MPWWLWVLVSIAAGDVGFVLGMIYAAREERPPSNATEALRELKRLDDYLEQTGRKMDELTARGNLIALLERVAFEKRACKLCREPIYFVRCNDGQNVVYSRAGNPHALDCPNKPKTRPRAPQLPERLFPAAPEDALEPKR